MTSYLDRPVGQVRRKDRQLIDDAWIHRFLTQAPFGHLAVARGGQPLLNGNLFWYDGRAIWVHTAPVGKFRAVVEAGANLGCFSVAEVGRILPADTPFEFSTEYASVIVYGRVFVEGRSSCEASRPGRPDEQVRPAPHARGGVPPHARRGCR